MYNFFSRSDTRGVAEAGQRINTEHATLLISVLGTAGCYDVNNPFQFAQTNILLEKAPFSLPKGEILLSRQFSWGNAHKERACKVLLELWISSEDAIHRSARSATTTVPFVVELESTTQSKEAGLTFFFQIRGRRVGNACMRGACWLAVPILVSI